MLRLRLDDPDPEIASMALKLKNGFDVNQYMKLKGKPLVIYALKVFLSGNSFNPLHHPEKEKETKEKETKGNGNAKEIPIVDSAKESIEDSLGDLNLGDFV